MQKKFVWMGLAFLWASSLQLKAQDARKDSAHKKWFVGSSLLMLGNFDQVNNPEYVQ